MKKVLFCVFILGLIYSSAFSVPITLFSDTDRYMRFAKDIIVAECISFPEQETISDGLELVDVNILKVLKGTNKPGSFRIATIYPMKPAATYMLCSLGGNTLGTDFLALPELSVVPLPTTFKIDDIEGKNLKEQIHYMFSLYLFEVERKLAPLLSEKTLLDKAVSDSMYEWYESDGPIKLGPITEKSTQTNTTNHPIWLDLDGERLQWSRSSQGTGFLYFKKIDESRKPYWEFSPCDANRVEDLAGKSLKTKFYGIYTPGRAESTLGWKGLSSIYVSMGQVLLARTADNPREIFAIQIIEQKQAQEHLSVRYSVIRQ